MAFPTTMVQQWRATDALGACPGQSANGFFVVDIGGTRRIRRGETAPEVEIQGMGGKYTGVRMRIPGNALVVDQEFAEQNQNLGSVGELSGNRRHVRLNRGTVVTTEHYVDAYFSILNGNLHMYATRSDNGYAPEGVVTTSMTSGTPIVAANVHDIWFWREPSPTPNVDQIRYKIDDITAGVTKLDGTYTLLATQSDLISGVVFPTESTFQHYTEIDFAHTPLVVPGGFAITSVKSSATTAEVTLNITGTGTVVLTPTCDTAGVTVTGGGNNLAAGNHTITVTGLQPLYHTAIRWNLQVGTSPATSGYADIVTEPAGIPDEFYATNIGDSIENEDSAIVINGVTIPAGQRFSNAIAFRLADDLGRDRTKTNGNAVAQNGYTSAQIAALLPSIYTAINGNGVAFAGTQASGTPHPVGKAANIVGIGLGTNDHQQVGETVLEAAQRTITSYNTIIAGIRANCPSNPVILLRPITGDQGSGGEGPLATTDRKYIFNQLLKDLEDVPNNVFYVDEMVYLPGVLNRTKLPDLLHPESTYRATIVERYVSTYLTKAILKVTGNVAPPLLAGVIALDSRTANTATFSSTTDASGGTGTLTYSWKVKEGTGNVQVWPTPGNNKAGTMTGLKPFTSYRVWRVVTDSLGVTAEVEVP